MCFKKEILLMLLLIIKFTGYCQVKFSINGQIDTSFKLTAELGVTLATNEQIKVFTRASGSTTDHVPILKIKSIYLN